MIDGVAAALQQISALGVGQCGGVDLDAGLSTFEFGEMYFHVSRVSVEPVGANVRANFEQVQ